MPEVDRGELSRAGAGQLRGGTSHLPIGPASRSDPPPIGLARAYAMLSWAEQLLDFASFIPSSARLPPALPYLQHSGTSRAGKRRIRVLLLWVPCPCAQPGLALF